MTAIERTADPCFKKTLTQAELDEFYPPTEEMACVNEHKGIVPKLERVFTVLLETD